MQGVQLFGLPLLLWDAEQCHRTANTH